MLFNVQTVASGGKVASGALKTGAGRIHWLAAYNANGAARYVQLFDAAALPNDGATPLLVQAIAAGASLTPNLTFPPNGLLFSSGLYVCLSTTADVKTIAAADLVYTAGIS